MVTLYHYDTRFTILGQNGTERGIACLKTALEWNYDRSDNHEMVWETVKEQEMKERR